MARRDAGSLATPPDRQRRVRHRNVPAVRSNVHGAARRRA